MGDSVDPLLFLQGGVGEHDNTVLLDQALTQLSTLLKEINM